MSRGTWEINPGSRICFSYRTITVYGWTFQTIQIQIRLVTSRQGRSPIQSIPTTPNTQRLRAWHVFGLGSFHFARRYSGNHGCFLFLGVLRCLSSPRWLQQPMYSAEDVATLPAMGLPIQRSPDQSLFSSSPRLFAACHVFHRLLVPRHPPSALNSLATKQLT